jgi:hypothetical protein
MRIPVACTVLFLSACSSPVVRRGEPVPNTPVPAPFETPTVGRTAEEVAAADKVNEVLLQKQKELRQKQHDLDYSQTEQESGALEAQSKVLAAKATLAKAEAEVAKTKTELDVWQRVQRPKELSERQVAVDRQAYAAEEAKDELAELEASYQADEFAKTTKELVLKRSRRKLELSERERANALKDLELLKDHTHPLKEKELVQKMTVAEADQQKAQLDLRKAELDQGLQAKKAKDRRDDLEHDVKELQQRVQGRS